MIFDSDPAMSRRLVVRDYLESYFEDDDSEAVLLLTTPDGVEAFAGVFLEVQLFLTRVSKLDKE